MPRPTDLRLHRRTEWEGPVDGSPSVLKMHGTTVARNLFTNPGFRKTKGVVTVTRNRHRNPGAEAGRRGFGGWYANNTVTPRLAPANWAICGSSYQQVWTNVVSPNQGDMYVIVQGQIETGKKYTLALTWRMHRSGMVVSPPNVASNSNVTTFVIHDVSRQENITANVGVQRRDWITFTATNTVEGDSRVTINILSKQDGDISSIADIDLYDGAYQPNRDWFSDKYSPDPDFTPSLDTKTGDSILTGKAVSNVTSYRCYPVQSTRFARPGEFSMRLVPTGTSKDSSVEFVVPMETRTVGGAMARVHIDNPIISRPDFPINTRRLRLMVYNPTNMSPILPDLAGSYSTQVIWRDLTAPYALHFYNGSLNPSDHVWWTDPLVVGGDTPEDVQRQFSYGYFSGDTRPR